jgi:hypothetical protein
MEQRIKQQLQTLRAASLPVFINGNGFVSEDEYRGNKDDDDEFITTQMEHVKKAYNIIPLIFEKTNRYTYKWSSHGVKHYCTENFPHILPDVKNPYISNGAFIVAMLLHGYKWKQVKNEGSNNRNCFFKFKSLKIFRQCKTCLGEKHVQEFPTMGTKISKRCDECSKVFNRTHKSTFDLVTQETRTEIQKYIADGFTLKRIANKFDIPYANLFYWQKRGFLSNQKI